MSSSSQNLLDTKLSDDIGLKELKIMQLKKKKVRVSASTDFPHHRHNDSESAALSGSVIKS
jgi:hypothetical protein